MSSRFMSALSLAAYLAAAFLPCEPSGVQPAVLPTQVESPHDIRAEAPPAGHATHASHAGHGPHEATATAAAMHAGHVMHAPRAERQTPAPPIPARRLAERALRLVPTCLCGCSETRSMIGGNVSRLGAVVPGVALAGLLADDGVTPGERLPGRFLDCLLADDPIPI